MNQVHCDLSDAMMAADHENYFLRTPNLSFVRPSVSSAVKNGLEQSPHLFLIGLFSVVVLMH
eukprot:CCRYP_016631-RF/>CCRYP_016631-RF protein AED:0.49 eAED:1.00 QI:0/0/0/1/0/0/3/0/61